MIGRRFLPHDPKVTREGMSFFTSHAVISEREGGLEQLRVIALGTDKGAEGGSGDAHLVSFPEPAYSVRLDMNPEFDTQVVRYQYQSLITPASVYDYDMNTQAATLLKRTPVLGGYDPENYVSVRLHAPASDGTLVPISLVSRKGVPGDGAAPLLLYGYGSYGFSLPVTFSSARVSLLDRGVTVALAHIRGAANWARTGGRRASCTASAIRSRTSSPAPST